nr:uncharacterized protein LOC129446029 isoform X2 [Misgurnus anguillicaudatus]
MRRGVTMHQIGVKQAKEGQLIPKKVLRKCRAECLRLIPGILDQLEEDLSQKTQFVLYGHLTAYFASIYGHRLGVFQNMTIKEVEKAVKSDSTGSYLINISLHKTNQAFGPAQLSLKKEEYHWFRRFLALREHLVGGPEAVYFFFTSTPNPCKNLNNYFQGAWVSMGLPSKPTFTDVRTSIATHARNTHNSDNRQKVAKLMCHRGAPPVVRGGVGGGGGVAVQAGRGEAAVEEADQVQTRREGETCEEGRLSARLPAVDERLRGGGRALSGVGGVLARVSLELGRVPHPPQARELGGRLLLLLRAAGRAVLGGVVPSAG